LNEDFRIKLPRWRVNVLFTPADAAGKQKPEKITVFSRQGIRSPGKLAAIRR